MDNPCLPWFWWCYPVPIRTNGAALKWSEEFGYSGPLLLGISGDASPFAQVCSSSFGSMLVWFSKPLGNWSDDYPAKSLRNPSLFILLEAVKPLHCWGHNLKDQPTLWFFHPDFWLVAPRRISQFFHVLTTLKGESFGFPSSLYSCLPCLPCLLCLPIF